MVSSPWALSLTSNRLLPRAKMDTYVNQKLRAPVILQKVTYETCVLNSICIRAMLGLRVIFMRRQPQAALGETEVVEGRRVTPSRR